MEGERNGKPSDLTAAGKKEDDCTIKWTREEVCEKSFQNFILNQNSYFR